MRHKDASGQLLFSTSGSEFQNTLLGKAKMDKEEINGNFLLRWNKDYEKSNKNFRQRLLNPRLSKFEGLEPWVNNKKVFIKFIKEKLRESRATIIERAHKKVTDNCCYIFWFQGPWFHTEILLVKSTAMRFFLTMQPKKYMFLVQTGYLLVLPRRD